MLSSRCGREPIRRDSCHATRLRVVGASWPMLVTYLSQRQLISTADIKYEHHEPFIRLNILDSDKARVLSDSTRRFALPTLRARAVL
jgi:hypothetical protein